MSLGNPRSAGRCLLVLVAVTGTAAALLAALAPTAATSGRLATLPLDQALAAGCADVAVGVVGWLWLVAAATVVEALLGRRPSRTSLGTGAAGAVRRAVLVACGLSLASGLTTAAHAAQAAPPDHDSSAHAVAGTAVAAPQRPTGVDGLPFPDRPVGGPGRIAPPPREVVVAPGDSLWSIATAALPGRHEAGDPDVAATVARLYARNRGVIGADPDLIVPGQHLALPSERTLR